MIYLRPILLVAVGMSAALHIRADARGPRWQVYLFKPLSTALLLALALWMPAAQPPRYQFAIVLGLACSCLGDVFLMLPRDRFVAGLASFLVAHLAYLGAFSRPPGTAPGLLLPLVLAGAGLLRFLWPGLGRLRLAVFGYAVAIVLMAWQAWARGWELRSFGPALAAAGATFFFVSDALLAVNRFGRPFRGAQGWVMSTYIMAQALIASSVGYP